MSSATGIRILYCEIERPGKLPSYPPEQHYGRCRHKGKHSGSDVAQLNKVRVPRRATMAALNQSVTGSTMMKKTMILSQDDKQLQWRNKLKLGTWNICSMLQLGLPRTGISSGTLRSVIEYGLPLLFLSRSRL